jgi:ABC-type transport system substrate-binding protein
MRRLLMLLAAVLGMAGLAGLQSPVGAAPGAPDLVIDTGASAVLNLDPIRYRSTAEKNALSLVYEQLTRYDNAMRLQPGLAEAWRVEGDRVTWTFTLRAGVRFHDGTPLTAQAVKVNLERMIDPRSVSINGSTYREAIEDDTCRSENSLCILDTGGDW